MRVIFMGTPDFAATILKKLIEEKYEIISCVSQPDKPVGRHMKMIHSPVKETASAHGINVFQPKSVRTSEFLEWIQEAQPDLIITAAYGKILPQTILDVPKYGCLNVHASLLPRFRGAAPIQWSILSGDTVTGITVMKMDAGMDTGDILSSESLPIGANVTTIELTEQLSHLGAQLLTNTIPKYIAGEIIPMQQDDSMASFSPPIRKEQGLIDWSESAGQVHNKIRAFSSWPGAYTYLNDSRIKIYTSLVDDAGCERLESYRSICKAVSPGTIIYASKTELSVACGNGCISLLCVQPESSKRINVCDCAHNYKVGQMFGGGNS